MDMEYTDSIKKNATISGKCGENLCWYYLEGNLFGDLFIEGEGEMQSTPWTCFHDKTLSVTIGEGCKNIAEGAFENHWRLRFVTIPDSVTEIGCRAFASTHELEALVIPESVQKIGEYAFSGCHGLIEVTIPRGVTRIEEGTFLGSTLQSVVIPDSVTEIGKCAFEETNLASVVIPECVREIGDEAFAGCVNLTNVQIPENLGQIGEDAFARTPYLLQRKYGKCGENLRWRLEEKTLYIEGTGCLSLDGPFDEPEFSDNIEKIVIGSGFEEIAIGAFYMYDHLKSVEIPESVKKIGDAAFGWCDSLSTLVIPDSVTQIGCQAFQDVPHIIYHGPAQSDDNWGALSRN